MHLFGVLTLTLMVKQTKIMVGKTTDSLVCIKVVALTHTNGHTFHHYML